MNDWYTKAFGREYLDLYAHRDMVEAENDIKALSKIMPLIKDQPLLDLCCGAGRHLLALHKMGFKKIYGLDLSSELLEIAARHLAGVGARHVEFLNTDMRAIPYQGHFATILSLFTSFGYFAQDDENLKVIKAVARALKPGGYFIIDYLNRDQVINNLVAQDEKKQRGKRIKSVRCLTGRGKRVEKTTTIFGPNGSEQTFHESVRLYSVRELEAMITKSGLTCRAKYGSISGGKFNAASKRLVMITQKNL
jgi:ubiquinone/menaquinone biosynthesis C-methylase UbiE